MFTTNLLHSKTNSARHNMYNEQTKLLAFILQICTKRMTPLTIPHLKNEGVKIMLFL